MQVQTLAPFRLRGMVLLEMLVAGCVLAILLAVAAPSFSAMSERWKVRTAVDALTSSLYAARAEAFRRGGHVTLARSNLEGCTSSGRSSWECGWSVFVDHNGNGLRDGTDELLFVGQPPRGLAVVQTSSLSALKFDAWGEIAGLGALSFEVSSRTKGIAKNTIDISSAGRIRVSSEPSPP